ncbi:MAG: ABC transporter permease [Spirochaetes bacterium]|nr:ABC transporter permease [Spirochaetota bacterium]
MNLFELFIGLRYLKAKKSQGIISFNTVLSIVIVCLGVFIIIIVISVMNGFQSQIKDKILDVNSHITLTHYSIFKNKKIKNYDALTEKIRSVKGVKSANPNIEGQALFRFRENLLPVAIRGMGGAQEIPEDVKKFITEPEHEIKFSRRNEVFIGSEMAVNYGIKIGDRIELFVPKGRTTARTEMQSGKGDFKVIGFFKTGYYEYDTSLILMSLKSAQNLYEIGNSVTGIGAKVFDVYKADIIAKRIQETTDFNFQTLTAEERNQNFFYALRLEKLIMTVILFLVIVSALFTIMGTLVMVVSEKKRAIGILKSMGAKPGSIMTIFVLEGFFIGLIGSVIGVISGLAASINLEAIIEWIERTINSILSIYYSFSGSGVFEPVSIVPKHVYYLDTIPTQISPEFIVTISIITVFLSTVSAIFPSWHASRLQPVETIRYE